MITQPIEATESNHAALLVALQSMLERATLRHQDTERRLERIEQMLWGLSPRVETDDSTRSGAEPWRALLTKLAAAHEQLERRVNEAYHHFTGLHHLLRPRIERLEQQLISRRFSDGLREKFEKHYPEHRWEDVVYRFDRWVAIETSVPTDPSGALRKFLKSWLGEVRPRWVDQRPESSADDNEAPRPR
jgi:hypothetical protein